MPRIRAERVTLVATTGVAVALLVTVLIATADVAPGDPDWLEASTPLAAPATWLATGALPTTTATAASPIAGQAAAADAANVPPADAWREVLPLGVGTDGELADVTTLAGGLVVAAGHHQGRPVVVVSPDGGDSWLALPSRGLPPGAARAVTADSERLVVVLTHQNRSTVWELRAEQWRAIRVEAHDGDVVVLSSAAIVGGRLVVGGYDSAGVGLWFEQGSDLVRVAAAALGGRDAGTVVVFDVAGRDGTFFAAGRAGDRAARWSSGDGAAWKATFLPVDRAGTATAVSADGGLVVGYDAAGSIVWTVSGQTVVVSRLPAAVDYPQAPLFMAGGPGSAMVATKEGRTRRCWQFTRDRTPQFTACPPGLFEDAARDLRAAVTTASGFVVAGSDHATGRSGAVWLYAARAADAAQRP